MPLPGLFITAVSNRANHPMVLWFPPHRSYVPLTTAKTNRAVPNGVTTSDQPGTHWLSALPTYIRGSMPRTGWPFSVSQFISSSASQVMVSSATMSVKFSMP